MYGLTSSPEWIAVLRKYGAPYLHMKEAMFNSGAFKHWTSENVDALVFALADVVNCYSPRNLLPITFSIELARYNEQKAQLKGKALRPITICATQSCQRIFGSLEPDPAMGNSTIEIYYDTGDRYLMELINDHAKKHKQPILKQVTAIDPLDMKITPGIQMADMIAWTAHRCLTYPQDGRAQMLWAAMRVSENTLLGRYEPYEINSCEGQEAAN